jgi:S1-C subfamily serine protease
MPVQNGLLVLSLVPGGAAEKAGLRPVTDQTIGDIIVGADGQQLNDMDDLYRLLDKKQIGDTVQLQVYRNGATTTVPVRLTAAPAASRTTTRRPVE